MTSASTSVETLFREFDSIAKITYQDFFQFLSFPSISAEASYRPHVLACASWLEEYLKESGFEVEIWQGKGYPVIYASWSGKGLQNPTVLIYNHYDVQPVDPIELWNSPPFEPTVRNGEVFARGAQDNKGQCFYVLTALRYLLKRDGTLPVNVKLCIEGEEEVGSASLPSLLKQKREKLKADHLLVVDVGIKDPQTPCVTLGLRGIVSLTLEVVGSKTDLHSGTHGGVAYNANHAMVEILAKLRDISGKIAIPGFYEDVVEITSTERRKLNFDFDLETYRSCFGGEPAGGEKAFSPIESAWLRPTVEINGISGGYTGEGLKTVIPARAQAKISCRLVPDQQPEKIGKLVSDFLKNVCPLGVQVNVQVHHGGGQPVRTAADSYVVQAAANAYTEIFQKPCQFILEGASIPIVPELVAASEAEGVLLGYGLPNDQIHAPNEHFGLDRFRKGFVTIIKILENLAWALNAG